MAKALVGAAEMAGAVVGTVLTGGTASPLLASLFMMGLTTEIGALGDLLSSNRGEQITTRQSSACRPILYGERQVGGCLVFQNTTASSHKTYNQAIVLAGHECDSILSAYFDGRRLYFDTGSVGSVTRNGVTFGGNTDGNTYVGPDGTHYKFPDDGTVFCECRYGDQPVGDLLGSLEANADGAWSTTANGTPSLNGLCWIYVKIRYNADLFPSRPELRFVVRGYNQIYDPRDGTYKYSNNCSLVALDVLLNTTWGLSVPLSRIDTDAFITAANICDEQVALAAGGTETRYTCNWVGDTSVAPGDILKAVLSSCAGDLYQSGGLWTIRVGAAVSPSLSLSMDDLRGSFTVTPTGSYQNQANRVRGQYIAPWYPYSATDAHGSNVYDSNGFDANGRIADNFGLSWQPSSFWYAQDEKHGYATDQWLAEDDGKILYRQLDLTATISIATAQRLGKIELLRTRLQKIGGTAAFGLAAYGLQRGDTFTFSLPPMGWENKLFEVTNSTVIPASVDESGNASPWLVSLQFREYDPTIFDWSVTEELNTYDVAMVAMSSLTVAPPTSVTLDSDASTAVLSVDGIATPRIKVTWVDPEDTSANMIQMQYKLHSDTNWTFGGTADLTAFEAYIVGIVSGQTYDVRIRSQRPSGAASDWVEIDSFTASTVYSFISSKGINPNSPYNVSNDATIDSIDESGAATVRVYGPGGVGTAWDLITGAGTISEAAGEITGLDYATAYYIVMDQSGDYDALTDYNASLADQYISVGSTVTIASDGTGGTTGGGYGGGSGGPRNPIGCTLEGTALDTPDGPLDNRTVYMQWASGQPVYLMGLHEPEKVIHAEWLEVSDIYDVTVGARGAFRCSGSHTLKHEGRYRWTETLPEHCFLNTRDDLEPATVQRIAGATGRVLRLELEGPSHEYSVHGVLSHNFKMTLPGDD